jgi:catechol 2,3-dioxygenase-like lactoylglutathione lyase family enzyme
MADHATPNLPSRDFAASKAFYGSLGFEPAYEGPNWMILERGGATLEFFHYPDLDPASSSFSCCLRLDDLASFERVCARAGVPDKREGWPRLHPSRLEASGLTIAYLVDPDGTLLRLIQNPAD